MTMTATPTVSASAFDTLKSSEEPALVGALRWLLTSTPVFTSVVRLAEFVLLTVVGLLIAASYAFAPDASNVEQYLLATVATAAASSVLMKFLGLYDMPALSVPRSALPKVMLAWTGGMVGLVFMLFFMKVGIEFSRVWAATWYVLGLVSLIGSRFVIGVLTRTARQNGLLMRTAVIYGSGNAAENLYRAIATDPMCDIKVCGLFDDRTGERVGDNASVPYLGNVDAMLNISRSSNIDMVILALPLAAENRVSQLVKRLWVLPIDIRLSAAASSLQFRQRNYSYVGRLPMLDLSDKPIRDWGGVQKWLFDKIIASLALVFLAPVMALVALAVKLESKGPVLFRQKRYGFNNELVEVFKFRSMYTDMADATAAKLVTKDDPRVTRVGRIIRKTSLDELPQLFNVLTGTLSLVGPRPHAIHAKAADKLYPEVVDGYFARHKVKPGITGWAQINGWRGETDTPEKIQKRVEHDIYYIENWSPMLDLYILLKTPLALLKTENAY